VTTSRVSEQTYNRSSNICRLENIKVYTLPEEYYYRNNYLGNEANSLIHAYNDLNDLN